MKIDFKRYKFSGIYCIKNVLNGKRYIGSAVRVGHRWCTHISDLKNNRHSNRHLQRAYNKYGLGSFTFMVIEKCPQNNLLEREQYFIDRFKTFNKGFGYNICPRANSSLGVKRSHEYKDKMSKAKFKLYSEGSLIGYWLGRKLSKQHKKNIGLQSIGRNLNNGEGTIEYLKPSKFGKYSFKFKYRARIWHNKKRWNLGCFSDKKDAVKMLLNIKEKRANLDEVEFQKYIYAVSENNKNKKNNKVRVLN